MEEIEDMERFWSEALQNLKEVVEKEESEAVDPPEPAVQSSRLNPYTGQGPADV